LGRTEIRRRLQAVPDTSAASLEGFITAATEKPLTVNTDGWAGYRGLQTNGYAHEAINLSASGGDASLRLPAIHLVFSRAKRWLLGTHHGAVRPKHLQHYLDEFVFRFNRRKANAISHGFARLVQNAVKIPPTT
jgi:transposase-like protein